MGKGSSSKEEQHGFIDNEHEHDRRGGREPSVTGLPRYLQRPEWEEEVGEEHYREYDDDDGPADQQCTKLLDELELRELSVLWRMAKKDADPTQLRAKVRNLEASPH